MLKIQESKLNLYEWGLLFVSLLGLILRFYPDGRSLWLDELFIVTNSYNFKSFYDLFRHYLVYDGTPPVYGSLIYFWIKIFGTSDYIVRLPSMIAGGASIIIPLVYGRRILGRPNALLLAAFISVSWGGIYYAHEARVYSLLILLSVILMIFSLKLIQSRKENGLTKPDLIILFLLGVLMCYSHFFEALLYFTNLLVIFVYLKKSRKSIFFLSLLNLLVFIPWVILNIWNLQHGNGISWLSFFPTWINILAYIGFVFNSWLLVCAFALILVLKSISIPEQSRRFINRSLLFPIFVLIVFFIVALTIDNFFRIIHERYLLASIPYFYLVAMYAFYFPKNQGYNLQIKRINIIQMILSSVLIAMMFYFSLTKFVSYEKSDWRGAAHSIATIDNIEKVYCVGNCSLYYHYLRGSDITESMLTNINKDGSSAIFKPPDGKVSILWTAHNVKTYKKMKTEIVAMGFEIMDKRSLGVNPKIPSTINKSRFIIFK